MRKIRKFIARKIVFFRDMRHNNKFRAYILLSNVNFKVMKNKTYMRFLFISLKEIRIYINVFYEFLSFDIKYDDIVSFTVKRSE